MEHQYNDDWKVVSSDIDADHTYQSVTIAATCSCGGDDCIWVMTLSGGMLVKPERLHGLEYNVKMDPISPEFDPRTWEQ